MVGIMNENIIKINLVEVAADLAHARVVHTLVGGIDYPDEDSLYEEDTIDCSKYKDEVQDEFNNWYDYYYNFILSLKV